MTPKLLSGRAIAKVAGVPKTTAQNYLKNYAAFFRWQGQGQQKRYDAHAIELVKFIRILYTKGYDRQSITQTLAHPTPLSFSALKSFQKLRESQRLRKQPFKKKKWWSFLSRTQS